MSPSRAPRAGRPGWCDAHGRRGRPRSPDRGRPATPPRPARCRRGATRLARPGRLARGPSTSCGAPRPRDRRQPPRRRRSARRPGGCGRRSGGRRGRRPRGRSRRPGRRWPAPRPGCQSAAGSDPASPSARPAGRGRRGRAPGPTASRSTGVEPAPGSDAGAAGDVRGPPAGTRRRRARRPRGGRAVGSRTRRDPPGEIGRHVVGPAAQHVAVLEQRGQHAGQAAPGRCAAARTTMWARRGWSGRSFMARPSGVIAPSASSAPRSCSKRRRLVEGCVPGAGRASPGPMDRACPRRPAPRPSRPGRLG